MDFDEMKKVSELALIGVSIDVERRGGSVYSVTFTDSAGHVVRVAHRDYTGLQVLVPAKPKMVTRHAVVGEVKGLKVDERFDDSYKAEQRAEDLRLMGGDDAKVAVESREEEEPF